MKTKILWQLAGALAGSVFLFTLETGAWAFASKKAETPGGGASVAVETSWVVKPDGAKKCGSDDVLSLEKGAEPLLAAKIMVLESKKKNDGKMRIEMCGAPAGTMNAYRIRKEDLGAALRLGFMEAPKGFAP